MNSRFLPWIRLAWAWVIAVVLCLIAAGVLIWQMSGPMGRQGLIEGHIEELSAEVQRVEQLNSRAVEERDQVVDTGEELERINSELFGQFERRMTGVLREVGGAARTSGFLPERFSYRLTADKKTRGARFSISFSVEGTYDQVRQMLILLKASPQFLIIDSISFQGEEDPRSQALGIKLQVSTYLADAEPEKLRALVELLEMDAVELEEAS